MSAKKKGAVSTGAKEDGFDYDGFYKELIVSFFYPLLKRAIPELYKAANRAAKPVFLDTEFRDILNTSDPEILNNPYYTDLVVEVPLKKGDVKHLLCHVEIQQGSGGSNLAERMYHYQTLIYAHYRKNPAALAIIAGARRKNERFYLHSHYGTEVSYRYNNLVLAELYDEELRSSDNPIDLALYAAKCALRAKEEVQKYKYMRTLLDLLSGRGWSKDDKRNLLLFLERVMNLRDKALEKQYVEYRTQLKREGKIVYIPLGERELAREIELRGEQRGIAKGKEEMAKILLADGFPPEAIAKSAGLPVEQIRSLMD